MDDRVQRDESCGRAGQREAPADGGALSRTHHSAAPDSGRRPGVVFPCPAGVYKLKRAPVVVAETMSNSFVRNGAMLDEAIASSPTPLLDAAGAASATTPTGIKVW